VAELVPVEGRDYPVLVRLDPRFLTYRWNENRWYFRSFMGLIPITPGDGRWVLHTPGGRNTPWQHGLCWALGRAWVRKTHAALHRDNWEAKLANPARVAKAPAGASDEQRQGWFQKVAAWGVNTVFSMPAGYDVALLESNGRGWESFLKTIEEQTREIQIALAGQTVTTDGGAGFSNSDIHKSIRADLIKELNTQAIPAFVLSRFGEDALTRCPVMSWDVTPPRDLKAEAEAMNTAGMALRMLTEALEAHGIQVDASAFCSKFGIPVRGDVDGDGKPDQQVEDMDQARAKMRPALVGMRDRSLKEAA
jgi:phage gp29-like protein